MTRTLHLLPVLLEDVPNLLARGWELCARPLVDSRAGGTCLVTLMVLSADDSMPGGEECHDADG